MAAERKELRFFARNEKGVTAMEYALIGTLVAVIAVVAITQIGSSVNDMFASVVIPS